MIILNRESDPAYNGDDLDPRARLGGMISPAAKLDKMLAQ